MVVTKRNRYVSDRQPHEQWHVGNTCKTYIHLSHLCKICLLFSFLIFFFSRDPHSVHIWLRCVGLSEHRLSPRLGSGSSEKHQVKQMSILANPALLWKSRRAENYKWLGG